MLTKRLSDLTVTDIQALGGVAESRYLDFKSAAVGTADRDRREFLADISAFANASGGDIVFGVTTKDGFAANIHGIELGDPDKEMLRLGDLIRSGAEPRLSRFDMVWLPIEGTRGVLVVRVPRSWAAPHRVTLQGHDKFYIRNPAGKHPMNVDELRQAFTLSQTIVERIRGFRAERVNVTIRDEGPFALKAGTKLVFHGVPLAAFVDPPSLNLDWRVTQMFPPFGSSGYSNQHTLEGLATHSPLQKDGVRAYTLLFRSGIVESIADLPIDQGTEGEKLVSLVRIERYIMEGWKLLLKTSGNFGIEPPFYVFVSLLNVRDVAPHIPERRMYETTGAPCRREHLLLPELEIDSESVQDADTVLFRKVFDQMGNAFGLQGSLNYGSDGQYLPQR